MTEKNIFRTSVRDTARRRKTYARPATRPCHLFSVYEDAARLPQDAATLTEKAAGTVTGRKCCGVAVFLAEMLRGLPRVLRLRNTPLTGSCGCIRPPDAVPDFESIQKPCASATVWHAVAASVNGLATLCCACLAVVADPGHNTPQHESA